MPILTPEERFGQLIAGRYRLTELLSSGGMGVLFRAKDEQSGEPVAVKMLKPAHALDADRVARFARETRIASAIRHPNIARVLEVWTEDTGATFLVMELLEGVSLSEELDRSGTLSFARTLELVMPIASALAAAHALGIVHRDIKPSNIFLCHEPESDRVVPKLLDFGIAKRAHDGFETDTGLLLGTPGYMPPEHAQYGECGPYSDIWALGAVIYRCLTGHPPHAGVSTQEMLAKLVREAVPALDVPGVGKQASATIDRALARDAYRRYPSMDAFASALRSVAPSARSGEETAELTKLEPRARRSGPSAQRRVPGSMRNALLAVLVLALALLGSLGTRLGRAGARPGGHAAKSARSNPAAVRPVVAEVMHLEARTPPVTETIATVSTRASTAAFGPEPPAQPATLPRARRSPRAVVSTRPEAPRSRRAEPVVRAPDPLDRRH